jgi:hypothetical protein
MLQYWWFCSSLALRSCLLNLYFEPVSWPYVPVEPQVDTQ